MSQDDLEKRIASMETHPAEMKRIAENRMRSGKLTSFRIFGAGVGVLSLAFGLAMALTSAVPASALWTGGIVCSRADDLEYRFSSSGFSAGRDTHFRCVGEGGSYDANGWAVYGLQFLFYALVVSAVASVVYMTWRRMRTKR